MKKFKFRLETVLKYKINLELLAKQRYQEKLRDRNNQLKRIETLNQEKSLNISKYNQLIDKTGDPDIFQLFHQYLVYIDHVIQKNYNVLQQIEIVLKERFDLWTKRRREVKVIKKIKTQKWKRYQFELDKAEQHFLDDIFIAKKVREMNYEEV